MFYAKELQKVQKLDDIYKVEKILAEKKENGACKMAWLGENRPYPQALSTIVYCDKGSEFNNKIFNNKMKLGLGYNSQSIGEKLSVQNERLGPYAEH